MYILDFCAHIIRLLFEINNLIKKVQNIISSIAVKSKGSTCVIVQIFLVKRKLVRAVLKNKKLNMISITT